MDIKPIKTEADYESTLKEIDQLFDAQPGTPESDKLEILVTLVEAYEAKHHKIPLPDPIDAIEHYMESRGLTRQELEPYIGSRSRVYEILNRKRSLTLRMIRNLEEGLGIPASILVQKYDLDTAEEGVEADIDVDDLSVRVAWDLVSEEIQGMIALVLQSRDAGDAKGSIISMKASRPSHRYAPIENATAQSVCRDIDMLPINQVFLGLYGCAGALSSHSAIDLPPERIH